MVCFCPAGRPCGKALALAVFFAYNDKCVFMPFPGRACIRKTCKERILYETRYQSLQCLQCILIPVHASSYSSLLRYLSFLCKFVYLAASSWQKGEHILRFKPTQPEKVMAAHGSKEDFSFHKRPFFFAYTSNVSVFYSIHQVCISAHLFPKKALYPHNDLLRIALV